MKIRLLPSLLVFVGSYLPLALILLAQDFDYALLSTALCLPLTDSPQCRIPLSHPEFSLTILGVCLVSFCFTLLTLQLSQPKIEVDILSARYVPSELMSYTLPYVVAFMSIGYQETGKFVGLLIFLMWMFWITYQSGQLILNPLLIAFGWRLYEVTYMFPGEARQQGPRNGRALLREQLEGGQRRPQVSVQDIMILGALRNSGKATDDGGA